MTPEAFAALMALSYPVPLTQVELEAILRRRLSSEEYTRWYLLELDQQNRRAREADEDPYQW